MIQSSELYKDSRLCPCAGLRPGIGSSGGGCADWRLDGGVGLWYLSNEQTKHRKDWKKQGTRQQRQLGGSHDSCAKGDDVKSSSVLNWATSILYFPQCRIAKPRCGFSLNKMAKRVHLKSLARTPTQHWKWQLQRWWCSRWADRIACSRCGSSRSRVVVMSWVYCIGKPHSKCAEILKAQM